MQRILAVFLILIVVVVNLFTGLPEHVAAAPPAPPHSMSRYMSNLNLDRMYMLGREVGADHTARGLTSSIVILAFGQPMWRGDHGTYIFSNRYASRWEIHDAVKSFGRGFWANTPVNGPRIRIVIGTSNYLTPDPEVTVNYAHGKAWAEMVNATGAFVSTAGWSSQITISGANDIEVHWSHPTPAYLWVYGYEDHNNHVLYDFGDAGSCYPYNPPSDPESCGNGWTRENVWWKAWGNPSNHSMPEIYTSYPTHAGQWQKISLWAALNKGGPIPFAGALANWDASGYNSNNYTPAQSWQVFYDKLASDSRAYIHGLGWSSDMTYGN